MDALGLSLRYRTVCEADRPYYEKLNGHEPRLRPLVVIARW